MNHTALVPNENNQERPILVVDREGKLGEALIKELKEQALVVYVSRKSPEVLENIVYVPFDKKIPTIPDNVYSHIFLIDENFEITKDVIKSFVKKSEQDKSFLILATKMSFVDEPFMLDFVSSYDRTKIVIIGDIFKKDEIYDSTSEINKYITGVKTQGRIYVPGDGTGLVAPVFFDDVVFGILETVFGTEENKIFYLFPKHRVTLLSLAHIFQKIDPELKIDFIKEDKLRGKEFSPVPEGKYLLGDSYDLQSKIKKIQFEKLKVEEVKNEAISIRPQRIRKLNLKPLFLALVLFLLLPLITTVVFALLGAGALANTKNEIGQGNISSSKASALFALNSFSVAGLSLQALAFETNYIGLDSKLSVFSTNIELGQNISGALLSTIDSSEKMKAILAGSSKDPAADFSKASIEIKNALYIYDKEKQLNNIPVNISQKLDSLTRVVSSTIDFWPDALGFNGTKNYLILFQNNMELRPGGGFIGSYAILTVSKGKIFNFKIYDIYDADGQLKGHIEPPYPIRRYLPSIHWYFRDSNFNVDFSKGAVASAVFLNTEMRQAVDGVIGVDLSFVKNLLAVVGPVNVTDYNQTVTSDNFFQIAQSHAQEGFFPGSTQKKDFLTSFYNALQNKIAGEKNLPYLDFAQAVINSINEKHILFAFNNPSEQAAFSVNGWSSSLVQDSQSDNSVINDFIGINEANLGGDKVNYYISRSISQDSEIKDDGSVNDAVTISFKNSASASSGTSGIYKNYLRFILPQNVAISGIQIDGQAQKIIPAITDPTIYEKKGFVPPSGLEVDKQSQDGKTVYGFLVTLGPQVLQTIKINYVLPQKADLTRQDLSYKIKVFKQPGVDFFPYALSLSFPANLKVLTPDKDLQVSSQKATLSTQIQEDREVLINLAAK